MGKFGYRCPQAGIKVLDDTKLAEYLQEIDFSGNPELDTISVKIATCNSLEKLIGFGCCIKSIPIELTAAKETLVEINLSNNMISELHPGLAAPLRAIRFAPARRASHGRQPHLQLGELEVLLRPLFQVVVEAQPHLVN